MKHFRIVQELQKKLNERHLCRKFLNCPKKTLTHLGKATEALFSLVPLNQKT